MVKWVFDASKLYCVVCMRCCLHFVVYIIFGSLAMVWHYVRITGWLVFVANKVSQLNASKLFLIGDVYVWCVE